MEWYLKVLKEHYADFNGRARRQEYWMFLLFNVIATIVVAIVDGLQSLVTGVPGILYGLYSFGVLIPGLAVSVRRLHDLNKSGWMLLVGLIPLVGGIIVLVWMCTEGEKGTNQYGADPKSEGNSDSNNPFGNTTRNA